MTGRPTSLTGRRCSSSCATPECWRQPRSDGRVTPTACCLPTSSRGWPTPASDLQLAPQHHTHTRVRLNSLSGTISLPFLLMRNRLPPKRRAPQSWRRRSWSTGPWGRPRLDKLGVVGGRRVSLSTCVGLSKSPSSKVFLKYYQVEQLNLMVQQATQRVVVLQACVRGWLGAKRYRRILKERERSAMVLQSGQFF